MRLFNDDTILITDNFNIGQDWEVPIVGFFIIGAKDKSKRSIEDFSEEELAELMSAAKKMRLAMKEVLKIRDVYLFQNEDTEHGFHLWLFPRHPWMEEFGRKIESVRPIMLHAQKEFSDEKHIAEVNNAARKVKEYLTKE